MIWELRRKYAFGFNHIESSIDWITINRQNKYIKYEIVRLCTMLMEASTMKKIEKYGNGFEFDHSLIIIIAELPPEQFNIQYCDSILSVGVPVNCLFQRIA